MRILFMGTPGFALPSLSNLLERSYTVPAVVTAPDKPRGRGREVSFTPVKELALTKSIPVLQPENLKDPAFLAAVKELQPDLIVVVAFRILPKEVYSIPKFGSINLHASLLPKYRGAAPINWAIMNGESETGVTTFFLQDKVDTGSIILQARVRIGENETAGELHDKLADVGAEIVFQTVRLIELGKAQPRQQEHSTASLAPKLFKEQCRINWNKPSQRIHNFVRGLSPVPCAWTVHGGKTLKVYQTSRAATDPASEMGSAGELVRVDKKTLTVRTGEGLLSILSLQQEGKKQLAVEEFLRGYPLTAGDRFE